MSAAVKLKLPTDPPYRMFNKLAEDNRKVFVSSVRVSTGFVFVTLDSSIRYPVTRKRLRQEFAY